MNLMVSQLNILNQEPAFSILLLNAAQLLEEFSLWLVLLISFYLKFLEDFNLQLKKFN